MPIANVFQAFQDDLDRVLDTFVNKVLLAELENRLASSSPRASDRKELRHRQKLLKEATKDYSEARKTFVEKWQPKPMKLSEAFLATEGFKFSEPGAKMPKHPVKAHNRKRRK